MMLGSELRDRYVVSQFLGDGGYGIVWHATDKQAGRDVAIRRDVAIKRMKNLGGGELDSLLAEAQQKPAPDRTLVPQPANSEQRAKALLLKMPVVCEHVCDPLPAHRLHRDSLLCSTTRTALAREQTSNRDGRPPPQPRVLGKERRELRQNLVGGHDACIADQVVERRGVAIRGVFRIR